MQRLDSTLQRINGKGYGAYKSIKGEYRFRDFTLRVDHVQADPFAAPSRLRAVVPWAVAGLPDWARAPEPRARAARDFIARAFRRAARTDDALRIDAGAQTVLDRTAVLFTAEGVELRFTVSLPARGRTVLGHEARELLCRRLAGVVSASARFDALDAVALARHCDGVEDQVALRAALAEAGLVGFVADGARLARRSGVEDRPLEQAIPWQGPASLRVTLRAPHAGPVTGTGIPRGVTVVVGGGFHGKSTLLRALEVGVYDHRPGDGREQVVADRAIVKIRAEDGRAVQAVDLSPFIDHLPYGLATRAFTTELASGSTSQAASLQEALELGAGALLLDEDTSATNFMIRDQRMQALVAKDEEPITPFVDRIRELWERLGVSTVLVMGGSGDYFEHADTVLQMHDYLPRDVTGRAREIARTHAGARRPESEQPLQRPRPRRLFAPSVDPRGRGGRPRIKGRGREALLFGAEEVDLGALAQLADPAQVRAIGALLARIPADAEGWLEDPAGFLAGRLEWPWEDIAAIPAGDLARPRLAEVMAVLNRLRGARFAPGSD